MAKIKVIGKNGRNLLLDKKQFSSVEIPYIEGYLKIVINLEKGLKRQIKKIKKYSKN